MNKTFYDDRFVCAKFEERTSIVIGCFRGGIGAFFYTSSASFLGTFPSRGRLFVSFRAVGTIFEDENAHRGLSVSEPLSAKTLARIVFLFHTCQSPKDVRLQVGDPSVKLCGFG